MINKLNTPFYFALTLIQSYVRLLLHLANLDNTHNGTFLYIRIAYISSVLTISSGSSENSSQSSLSCCLCF